jgi:hypothetical protein
MFFHDTSSLLNVRLEAFCNYPGYADRVRYIELISIPEQGRLYRFLSLMEQGSAEGNNVNTRWVMVAGTGLVDGTPIEDINAARAIGAELARSRYGLITGGWAGVDHIATEAFVTQLTRSGFDRRWKR